MSPKPAGTVTFLFTDIEGSTRLLQAHQDEYEGVLVRQREIIIAASGAHDGEVVDTAGDSCFVAFSRAGDAVLAAVESQRALAAEIWPGTLKLRVRMGLHTGAPVTVSGGYVGLDVHKAARIASAAHGGQILASSATVALVQEELPADIRLKDLGQQRLRDLTRPDTLYQVETDGLQSEFAPLKTLDSHPNNLPLQPTELVGRASELRRATRLLASSRLLTLTGPGGTGKTRLALQLAADVIEEFEDGVFFTSLAAITDPANVPDTIAEALSVSAGPGETTLEAVHRHLGELHLLLVLDNFEQVVAAAAVVSGLLAHAPKLKVMVTSRESLGLSGEQEYPVPPLILPEPGKTKSLEVLSECEAVRLFIQRAQAVNPGFHVTDANAPAVAEICARLDGLPLSIELAAARMKLFSPHMLLERLGKRFDVLSTSRRNLPERQQTLRNTIDWSYNLLSEGEKALFARLAVFTGGFTLEAAERVCGSPSLSALPIGVLDGIESLLNKSLLRKSESGQDDDARFWMLETIREYAVELLAAYPDAGSLRDVHAAFFAGLSDEFYAAMWRTRTSRADDVSWIRRIAADYDNFRSAIDSATSSGEVRDAYRMVGNLQIFFLDQSHHREAGLWAERLSGRGERVEPLLAARVHIVGGMAAHFAGNESKEELEYLQAETSAREAGDENSESFAMVMSANLCLPDPRRHGEVEERLMRAYELCRKASVPGGLSFVLNSLGELYRVQGRYQEALAKYEESLAQSAESAHPVLNNIGFSLWHQGRSDEAEAMFRRVLSEEREGTLSRHAVSYGLLGMAAVAENSQRAVCLLAGSDALLDSERTIRDYSDQLEYNVIHERVKSLVDGETFERLSTQARGMSIDEIVAYALGDPGAARKPAEGGR